VKMARKRMTLGSSRTFGCLLILVTVLSFSLVVACGARGSEVVVYVSLDQPFSEPILKTFERETGIKVKAVYDVEAAKTTGLVNRLIAESSRPNADVFWNNECAQTILLQERGLLEPYDSPSAGDIPQQFRDPEANWAGFAARSRVIIVNTDFVEEEDYPRSIFDLLDPAWRGEIGIANPLFGTTATHAAALFAILGEADAEAYFRGLLTNEVRVVDGNSVVRDMVVSGELKVGLTDTDDAFVAIERGDAVTMIFPDQDGIGTFSIPNTVMLVAGAPNPHEARLLIDYLLSREVEEALAHASSRQMPVRSGVSTPGDMPSLADLRSMDVHPQEVTDWMDESSAWLQESFLR
jgi:iron(III) transport system substrate-binding protein